MLRVDADAHVLENRGDLLSSWTAPTASTGPEVVGSTNGSGSGDEYWLVDGTLRLKSRNVGKDTPLESRELRDVAVRLKHMDELKVDIQVIFPTIFIIPLTPRPRDRAGAVPQLQPLDGRMLEAVRQPACAGWRWCRSSARNRCTRRPSWPRRTAR